jgi:hypothetical protein
MKCVADSASKIQWNDEGRNPQSSSKLNTIDPIFTLAAADIFSLQSAPSLAVGYQDFSLFEDGLQTL